MKLRDCCAFMQIDFLTGGSRSRSNGVSHYGALLAIVGSSILLLSCVAPDARLPPITRRPTTEHHVGKVVWLDLATPDPEIAKRFYGKLFGWSFYSDPNDAGYITVYLRDHLIGGIVKPSVTDGMTHQSAWLTYLAVRDADPEGAVFALMTSSTGDPGGYARATLNELPHGGSGLHSSWINFVRVEDAADTVAKAVALGGRTLVSPHVDRHGGQIALIADPQGAWFGVMEWPDGEHPRAAK